MFRNHEEMYGVVLRMSIPPQPHQRAPPRPKMNSHGIAIPTVKRTGLLQLTTRVNMMPLDPIHNSQWLFLLSARRRRARIRRQPDARYGQRQHFDIALVLAMLLTSTLPTIPSISSSSSPACARARATTPSNIRAFRIRPSTAVNGHADPQVT